MFTTKEVSSLTGLPVDLLKSWVQKGLIRPVIRGYRGRGSAHIFSPQQALALATVGAAHDLSDSYNLALLRNMLAHWERFTEEELKLQCLTIEGYKVTDAWHEEQEAAEASKVGPDWLHGLSDEYKALCREAELRTERVAKAICQKWDQQDARTDAFREWVARARAGLKQPEE